MLCVMIDMFVLLIHLYNSKCKSSNAAAMIMSSPMKEWDIGATTEAHSDIANDMLAIHGLSGADTVATTAWHWQGNFQQSIKDWTFLTL